jgi:ATP-dependent DNA helicase RecG
VSYPLAAMEEAVVNAVYHRSYESQPEPTKIYLYPDRIEITSYPGPVPGILPQHLARGARIPPVPARNRRIGEFLKELRLAEGRGTGIPKVYRSMEDNGSPSPTFDFDEGRTYFRTVLPAHSEYVAITALRDAAHLRAVGDPSGAVERLRRSFRDSASSPTIAAALIEALAREGNLVEAESIYAEFSQGVPVPHPRVISAISNALLDAGREQDARALLDQLPPLLSDPDAIEAGMLEKRAGRLERAHRYFERAGPTVQHDARALHEFANTKMRLAGKLARDRKRDPYRRDARLRILREARQMLERVLQMDAPPARHAWAWFHLSQILQWLNAPKSEVKEALEHAAALLPAERRFREEMRR